MTDHKIPQKFIIPLMGLQGTLLSMDEDKRILQIRRWLERRIEEKRTSYGIKGKGYSIVYDLELGWYPIIILKDRWLASDFLWYLYEKKKTKWLKR